MAKKKKETIRREIRKSLIGQLRAKGADVALYIDQIEDYMTMWDLKDKYTAAIRDASPAMVADKDFMPAKQFPIINRQMLSLLKQMGISPDTITKDGDEYGDL